MQKLNQLAIDQQLRAMDRDEWLEARLSLSDERGDVTPRMVGAALMAGTAIVIFAIVRTRLTTRANTLDLGS